MTKFIRDDIPKGTCFSHESIEGAYYEDTEPGEVKHWHRYNSDGYLCNHNAVPLPSRQYYISDKYGNPLEGEEKNFYQFMCKHENGGYKLTTAKYKTIQEAQNARAKDSKWKVIGKYSPSCESIFVVSEAVWQWIYEVEPGTNGYTTQFNLSPLLTEYEAYCKYSQSLTIKSYYKINKSKTTRDCK